MPERRPTVAATTSSSSSSTTRGVRRNLFNQHLPRRPTTSSTSTSVDTLRLGEGDTDGDGGGEDIVIRDPNGDFELEDIGAEEEGGEGDAIAKEDKEERKRLAHAVKDHQREKHRTPSEPAELLEAVRARLHANVAALSEDNWMYEAEDELLVR